MNRFVGWVNSDLGLGIQVGLDLDLRPQVFGLDHFSNLDQTSTSSGPDAGISFDVSYGLYMGMCLWYLFINISKMIIFR